MKVKVDKIASSTRNVPLSEEVEISSKIEAKEGNLIVVKSLEEKSIYGEIELIDGSMSKISKGDMIVGVLGERKALKGFKGEVPQKLEVGDVVNVLNLGGILGKCTSENHNFGTSLKAEVQGTIVSSGRPVNLRKNAIEWKNHLEKISPIILVSGTCMESGKTTVACEIIRGLKQKGYRIVGAKLTGISCLKDINKMVDYGALFSKIFTDAGMPSTTHVENVVVAAKGILSELSKKNPDIIVAELGDGLLGGYGVTSILKDDEIMNSVKVHIFCATDPVGAYGGKKIFEELERNINIISGPTTDNDVGVECIEKELGVPAANAKRTPEKLVSLVLDVIENGKN